MSLPLTPEDLERLRDAEVHVVGLAGTEGAAIARFLASRGFSRVHAHDIARGAELERAFSQVHVGLPRPEREALWRELVGLDIDRHTGPDYLAGIEHADAIFASQGWYLYPANRPALDRAREAGTPFFGLMHLYFGLAPCRTVAVTGSNGKSTTSRLVEHFLRRSGLRTWYAGNERRSVQVLDRLDEMRPEDLLVLEVSNRHLVDISPQPDIGVVTNVLPNHLAEHGGSFDEYRLTKRRLIERQRPDQVCVLNADDPASDGLEAGTLGRALRFSIRRRLEAGAWIEEGRVRVCLDSAGGSGLPDGVVDAGPVDALPLPGRHNVENLLAAALAALAAGAPAEAISRAVPTFRGLRHRIQLVWAAGGVEYYDDLNATSPQATIAAIEALAPRPSDPAPSTERRLVLIAGGDDKGLDMRPLAESIRRSVRRLVLLPGEGSAAVERALAADPGAEGVTIERFVDFATAVDEVVRGARPGERVLLSPACPGFFSHNYGGPGHETGFRALLRAQARRPAGRTPGADLPEAPLDSGADDDDSAG